MLVDNLLALSPHRPRERNSMSDWATKLVEKHQIAIRVGGTLFTDFNDGYVKSTTVIRLLRQARAKALRDALRMAK